MTPVRTRTRAGLVTVVVTAVIALFAGPAPAAIAAAPTDSTGPRRARALGRYGTCR
jgi:hypothetical protein